MGLLDVPPSSDRTLCEQNFNKIRMQRERFAELEEKSDNLGESSDGSRSEPSARVVPEEEFDDPLTAALKQREAREEEDKAAQSSRRSSRRESHAKYRRGSSGVVDTEKEKRLVRFICARCRQFNK